MQSFGKGHKAMHVPNLSHLTLAFFILAVKIR